MRLFGLGRSDNGYGEADRKLATALRAAKSAKEADKIARNDGHKNAEEAVHWLKGRS